jgi:8-oxo-dGTP pyrophosphatase MutT (NUDIX family)
MAVDPEAAQVKAAGGVLRRPAAGGGVELAVVHRPRYDDWSFPKGKLDAGEGWEAAALREVQEETGLRCRLLRELPPVGYSDNKGRPKVVRYWLMEPGDGGSAAGGFVPNDEVDELRWLAPEAAERLLSYPRDVELARAAVR